MAKSTAMPLTITVGPGPLQLSFYPAATQHQAMPLVIKNVGESQTVIIRPA